jgi:hypothetical protein
LIFNGTEFFESTQSLISVFIKLASENNNLLFYLNKSNLNKSGYNFSRMSNRTHANPSLMANILLDRLERISADSSWAHQASGVRASIAKIISQGDLDLTQLSPLLELGFLILENAAGNYLGGLEMEDKRRGTEKKTQLTL